MKGSITNILQSIGYCSERSCNHEIKFKIILFLN